jgi:hypothetical protein
MTFTKQGFLVPLHKDAEGALHVEGELVLAPKELQWKREQIAGELSNYKNNNNRPGWEELEAATAIGETASSTQTSSMVGILAGISRDEAGTEASTGEEAQLVIFTTDFVKICVL